MTDSPARYIDLNLSASSAPPERNSFSPLKKRLWQIANPLLFANSPVRRFMWWRRALLRFFGAQIGPKVQIRPTVKVACPWNLVIGARVWIGDYVEIYSLDKIEIQEDSVISQYVYLCAGSHDYNRLDFRLTTKPVRIEKQAWIATRSFIAPGVTVGQGAIVGAQSVVLGNVPPATIYRGNPAVFVKQRPLPASPEASSALSDAKD